MKVKLLFLALLIGNTIFGQSPIIEYTAPISNQKEGWNELVMPIEIFENIKDLNFSDLRLYGINDNNDTIETPYFVEQAKTAYAKEKVEFKTLNQVKKNNNYYYTFKISGKKALNEIELKFRNQNYDWLVDLEGSNDQNQWFSVLEKYRILDINNSQTSYQFNTLYFKELNYNFLRVTIHNPSVKPNLVSAGLIKNVTATGRGRLVQFINQKNSQFSSTKTSEIKFSTINAVPLHSIQLNISYPGDYYRNARLSYLRDSYLLKERWQYNYVNLWSGTLSSLEKAKINFNGPIANKYKLTVENQDNPALKISLDGAKSNLFLLKCQLQSKNRYFIQYGNHKLNSPNYDIVQFRKNAPSIMNVLTIGSISTTNYLLDKNTDSLKVSKIWLWCLMLVIIAILSWFSYKMLAGKSQESTNLEP